jgi:hypothetical protein
MLYQLSYSPTYFFSPPLISSFLSYSYLIFNFKLLLGFLMQGVFSTKLAILFLLDLFLLLFFITGCSVVASLAFCALEYNYISHPLLA